MEFLKKLFGYHKAEVVITDTGWHGDLYVGTTPPFDIPPPAEEYHEEPVKARVKPRKPKKLNKGITKKAAANKIKTKGVK